MGTMMSVAGSGVQAFGQIAAGFQQHAQDTQNAKIDEQNAVTAGMQGAAQSYQAATKTAQEVGTQKADIAANNVSEGSVSAGSLTGGTQEMGKLDQSALQFTTASKVNSDMYQASEQKSAANAAVWGGFINAAGTMLGAAGQAYSNQAMMSKFGTS